ncbi:unnamed protein product, partial [Prorocentrum cordatum]
EPEVDRRAPAPRGAGDGARSGRVGPGYQPNATGGTAAGAQPARGAPPRRPVAGREAPCADGAK